MALIELKDITKTYDLGEVKVHALRSTTLNIERGEYVALIGPSGSGKSTLMNTLGCLDRPTSGSYLLDGKEIVSMSSDARAKIRNRKIGFVFQNFNLLSRTSAEENVELPLMYNRSISPRRAEKNQENSWSWSDWPIGLTTTPLSFLAANSNGSRLRGACQRAGDPDG